MTSDFTIVIDNREQKPYTFQNIKPEPPQTITQGLKTGDYSIMGLENKICIERKEKSDLFNSMGKNRDRFKKEIIRMSEFDYAGLVIETSLAGIFTNPPSRSQMSSKAVFRSLISFSIKQGVHVWPMWSRESAEKATYLILKRYWDNCLEGKNWNAT